MTKKEIRGQVREKRRALSEQEWREKSHHICEKIRRLSCYQQADMIYAYLAKTGEVCLDELIQDALDGGKQVAIPKVLGAEMEFYRLRDLTEVEIGCMGIREPLSRELLSQGALLQGDSSQKLRSREAKRALMLLPAVAVDEQCHRVGYGGGYYDKYLEKHPQIVKMAVVFEFQVYHGVPTEALDVSPDRIVTEERVLIRQTPTCDRGDGI